MDKWVETWSLDYVSTEEVYWQIPGAKVDLNDIPSRAFDSPLQRTQTQAISMTTTRFSWSILHPMRA